MLVTTGVKGFNGSLGLGYEWQHQLGRFQLYYGYDGYLAFSRHTQTFKVVNSSTSTVSAPIDIVDNYFSVGASALAGVKFYVHPRFSLGLEAAYSARYYQRHYDDLLPDIFAKQRFDATGFTTNLTPISAFNATFHFGKVVR